MRATAVDLFCGVGGFSLGIEQAGFDILTAVDLDPINCCCYKFNFPVTPIICRNISTATGDNIRDTFPNKDTELDLVFGGSPCQSFSINGKRDTTDNRSKLPFEFVRLVKELQPKYFLYENVKGLTIGKCKAILLQLIEAFQAIDYKVNYQVLNASNYNVPQLRERLFLLGCKQELQLPEYPLPITSNSKTASSLPLCINSSQAIADLPNIENNSELLMQDYSSNVEFGKPSSYAAIARGFLQLEDDYSYQREYDCRILTSSSRTIHTPTCIKRFAAVLPGREDAISHMIKLHSEKESLTITANLRMLHYQYNRVLTVREAARIQTFPDYFQFNKTRVGGNKQVGNAVPPMLAKVVGAEVIKVLNISAIKPNITYKTSDQNLLSLSSKQAESYFNLK